jgi:hypothetical protein
MLIGQLVDGKAIDLPEPFKESTPFLGYPGVK